VEHGEAPIAAVHDPGLLRFLSEAWTEARRAGHRYDFLDRRLSGPGHRPRYHHGR
jgi:hypothetical protein